MELILTGAVIGFGLGVGGYIITQFWIRPILRYKRIKRLVASGLTFYVNGKDVEKMNNAMKQRMKAYRRHAAELSACYSDDLPYWYKLFLASRGESLIEASKHLMTLSNTYNYKHAVKRVEKIKQSLRIK